MFLPLPDDFGRNGHVPRWRWFGSLPEERKWGPALGTVCVKYDVITLHTVSCSQFGHGRNPRRRSSAAPQPNLTLGEKGRAEMRSFVALLTRAHARATLNQSECAHIASARADWSTNVQIDCSTRYINALRSTA